MSRNFNLKSSNPNRKKCIFIGCPKETIGYTFYLRSEGKIFVAKNGSCLEKEFLSKELSGRKVELDEVIVTPSESESSAARENVPVVPTPTGEEINDDDQGTSDQVTTELRRSTRTRSAPEWYGNPILEIMLLDNGEPSNYEEALLRFGFELIRLKLFHISIATSNFKKQHLRFLAKP